MLEPPDTHHVLAAIGWLELGNRIEARAELARVSPPNRTHPDVLETHWAIDAVDRNWESALDVARALIQSDPKRSSGYLHQAYALRRVPSGGLQAAWDALVPVADEFPDEPTIPYNLSCYACQMGRMDEARSWLQRAFKSGGKTQIKKMAMSDEDLKPLWSEINTW